MKNADQVFDNMTEVQLPKRIYQSRPDIVLNIGNEYLTMMLMEELKSKYPLNNLISLLRQLAFEHAQKTHLHQIRT